jgi:nucleoside-triphosphatase THEP1
MTSIEARDLAKRIQVLPDTEQVKILSRVMQAEGRRVAWSEVEAIQRRMGKLYVDQEKLTREIVESVREVRRERRRRSRS